MATYVIDGIRIEARTGRITHVRWGLVNTKTNSWAEARGPIVEEALAVVDKVRSGDTVQFVLSKAGGRVLGPHARVEVYQPSGYEGIGAGAADPAALDDVERI